MHNESSDRMSTIFVAVLGLALVAFGWYRATTPTTYEVDPIKEKAFRDNQAKAKANGGPGGFMSVE